MLDQQAARPRTRMYDMSGPNVKSAEVGFPEFEGSVEEEGLAMWGFPSQEMVALMGTGKEGTTAMGLPWVMY
jgi:hypothetical protein